MIPTHASLSIDALAEMLDRAALRRRQDWMLARDVPTWPLDDQWRELDRKWRR